MPAPRRACPPLPKAGDATVGIEAQHLVIDDPVSLSLYVELADGMLTVVGRSLVSLGEGDGGVVVPMIFMTDYTQLADVTWACCPSCERSSPAA